MDPGAQIRATDRQTEADRQDVRVWGRRADVAKVKQTQSNVGKYGALGLSFHDGGLKKHAGRFPSAFLRPPSALLEFGLGNPPAAAAASLASSLAATPPANDAACSGRIAAHSLSLSGGAQIRAHSSSNCTDSPCHRVVDAAAAAAASQGHLHHSESL